jgi:hypothetical protein
MAQDSAGTWLHQFILGTAGAPWVLLYEGQHSDPSVVDVYYSIWNYVYMIVEIDGLDVTMTTMERVWDGTPGVFSATDVFSYSVYSRSDLDLDDDVDGYDFLTFSTCFNGSLKPPQSGCPSPKADTDGDGDVDGMDFITFSLCFNGSENPPNIP